MASLEITLWETNDFPPVLVPVSGIVCSNRERHRLGLLISAVDDDLAPHADPFTFDLTDGDLASNWTIIQLNGLKKTAIKILLLMNNRCPLMSYSFMHCAL